jgi:thiol-disulfide isomerase/thioredoxin
MRLFFIICIICLGYAANAQVNLITVEDLNKRIANGKDTTYVINFWATWCTPCVAELPNFEKLRLANLNRPVKVLLISLDFKSKLQRTVIRFITGNHINADVFLLNTQDRQADIQRINKQWSGAIPATLFVNKRSRKFYEKEFTQDELKDALLEIRQGPYLK